MKVKINRTAVRSLLKEPGVSREVGRRARAIAAAAGPGHEVDERLGRVRARASVRTATYEARRSEAEDRTLTRAIDAGR